MYLILGPLRDLVKMSISWSFELTKLVATHPDAIFSLMKCNPPQYAWSSRERLGWRQYVGLLDYHKQASFVHHSQILAPEENVLAI